MGIADFIYYSVQTFSVFGLEDLGPKSAIVKVLSSLEILAGIVWVAAGIGLIVTLVEAEVDSLRKAAELIRQNNQLDRRPR